MDTLGSLLPSENKQHLNVKGSFHSSHYYHHSECNVEQPYVCRQETALTVHHHPEPLYDSRQFVFKDRQL